MSIYLPETIEHFSSFVEVSIAINIAIFIGTNFKKISRVFGTFIKKSEETIEEYKTRAFQLDAEVFGEPNNGSNTFREWKSKKISKKLTRILNVTKYIDKWLVQFACLKLFPTIIVLCLMTLLVVINEKNQNDWTIFFVLLSPFFSITISYLIQVISALVAFLPIHSASKQFKEWAEFDQIKDSEYLDRFESLNRGSREESEGDVD